MAAADVTGQIVEEVYQAACIVFLGFAYHSQNMRMLKPKKASGTQAAFFGTAYNMSDSDVGIVTSQLVGFLDNSETAQARTRMIKLENKLTCADLFDYYAKSLSGD